MQSKLMLFLFALTLSSTFLTTSTILQATPTNTPPQVSQPPQKPKPSGFDISSIIKLPYTDPECYVTVESIDVKKIDNKNVIVGGFVQINRDISNKTVYIKIPDKHVQVYLEDQIRKPVKAGDRRKFKTYCSLRDTPEPLAFGVKDFVLHTYNPHDGATFANSPLDCYNSRGYFTPSKFAPSKEIVEQLESVNMQYPFYGEFYLVAMEDQDFILTKPLIVKFQVYEQGANSKRHVIYEKDLPPLTGFISKDLNLTYSIPWDYKDQKGKPVKPNQFYWVDFILPESYEYKLVGSDEVKISSFYPDSKKFSFSSYFSGK